MSKGRPLYVVILIGCVVICSVLFSPVAALAQNLAVLVDGSGAPLGATLTTTSGATAGEVFVDPNGVVGFVSCDRSALSYDLGSVAPAAGNCQSQPSKWSGSLFQHVTVTPLPVLQLLGGISPITATITLPLPKAGHGCIICEPVDPTDPAECLINPACDLAHDGWLQLDEFGGKICRAPGISCDWPAPTYFVEGRGKVFKEQLDIPPPDASQMSYYLQGLSSLP